MIEELVNIYQNLHEMPELSLQEFNTSSYVYNYLSKLNCKLERIETSIIAFFDNLNENTIGFRCELDAINVNGVITHACGHDAHMSILLNFANYVNSHKFNNNVVLIFQMAEEKYGGARYLIDNNYLLKYQIKYMFALHLLNNYKYDQIISKENSIMAASREIKIIFNGKSVHIGKYKEGIDAIEQCCLFINKLYQILDNTKFNELFLNRFGSIIGGSTCNVISDYCTIHGSIRFYDLNDYLMYLTILSDILPSNAYVSMTRGYLSVENSEKSFNILNSCCDVTYLESPLLLSEDFSYYKLLCPTCFYFIGTNKEFSLHSSNFEFDYRCLLTGFNSFVNIINYLNEKKE